MPDIKIDKIIRSQRRTISLAVTADATLIIRAPLRTTLEYIQNLVWQKRLWINEKQKLMTKNRETVKIKNFVDDEEFLYLGQTYKLKTIDDHAITITDALYFPKKYQPTASRQITLWYKNQARKIITARVNHYAQLTGWRYRSITINQASTRWGSCGPNNSLNFTWKLVMAPLEIIDYVVIHELAHLIEKNHSSRFWRQVANILPSYQERRRWLKDNGRKLTIQ